MIFGENEACYLCFIVTSKQELKLISDRGETDIGMKRLALSDADKQVRDWFVETTKELGCTVKIDAMGELQSPVTK